MKQGEMKKFKDIHALEQAYFALEKEFTRKCQRLRELEKLLGTMEENSTPSRGRDCAEDGRTVLPQTEQTAPAPCKGTDDPDLKVGPLPGKPRWAGLGKAVSSSRANSGRQPFDG